MKNKSNLQPQGIKTVDVRSNGEKEIWNPYIKPTRRLHDSGYRVFEVGYCVVSGAKVIKKKVLGSCADHIYEDYSAILLGKGNVWKGINIDLTRDGYIRFFSHHYNLTWGDYPFCLSSMGLHQGEPL